jgi:DNA-binding beta-propeller fold protein YncE
MITRTLILATFAAMPLAGCKTTPTATSSGASHIFYPAPPTPPRLQFVTAFSDGKQLAGKTDSGFAQWVVGEAKASPTADRTRFESPYGLAVHNNRVYICDVGFNRVHIVDLATRQYDILKSDRLKNPVNITIEPDGTKYVADSGAGKVLVFDAQDRLVSEIGEPGQWVPIDVAVRGNEVFVTDTTGGEVEVWSKQGSFLRKIGEKGMGPDQLQNPTNLDFGPDGRLYVVDTFLQIVKVFDPAQGHFAGTVGRPGQTVGTFARPKGIAIAPDGTIYVADSQWDVVQIFNPAGQLLLVLGEPGKLPHSMGLPAGVAVDRSAIEVFRSKYAPNFEPEYLVFVVNQFGTHKIGVWAYGRDRSLPATAYQVDEKAVEQRREEIRRELQERAKAGSAPRQKQADAQSLKPAAVPAPAPAAAPAQ